MKEILPLPFSGHLRQRHAQHRCLKKFWSSDRTNTRVFKTFQSMFNASKAPSIFLKMSSTNWNPGVSQSSTHEKYTKMSLWNPPRNLQLCGLLTFCWGCLLQFLNELHELRHCFSWAGGTSKDFLGDHRGLQRAAALNDTAVRPGYASAPPWNNQRMNSV